MVDELRAEAPPELDWAGIEERLLARIAEPRPSPRRVERGSTVARVLGFAAAAAVAAIGLRSMVDPGASPRVAQPASRHVEAAQVALASDALGVEGARDLTALRVGDVIEARGAPVTFGQAGLVTWTLAPG